MSTEPAAPVLLYVEDEFLIQDMLVTALEEAGFHVLVANDGNQALNILASPTQTLNGLITDINLGTGPDGWDVSRTAREKMSGLPVVYVSAASDHEWTSRGVSTTEAFTFAGLDGTRLRWLRLPLPGQANGTSEMTVSERARGHMPEAFRRLLAGALVPGSTLLVTRESLRSGGTGKQLTLFTAEAPDTETATASDPKE